VVRGFKHIRLKIIFSKVARNKDSCRRHFDKKIQNLQLEQARSINRDDDDGDDKDDQNAVTIIHQTRAKRTENWAPQGQCVCKHR
jgi:hypothetical protein